MRKKDRDDKEVELAEDITALAVGVAVTAALTPGTSIEPGVLFAMLTGDDDDWGE